MKMPKKSEKTNPRIEITTQQYFISLSHDEQMRELQSMVPDIIRHIDGVDSRGRNVSVIEDIVYLCEFCGEKWTESSDFFNGGCCDKDMEYETC